MPVEIDENELMQLRRLQGVATQMLNNPKAKRLLEQAHKEVDPAAPTPTLEQDQLLTEASSGVRKEMEDLKAQLAEEKAEREKAERLAKINDGIETGIKELRQAGWQEDGIKLVRDLMDEKGITDPMIAAAYVEKQHPPQQPATPSSTGAWNFLENVSDGEEDLNKLISSRGEDNMLVDKLAFGALNDVRGTPRR